MRLLRRRTWEGQASEVRELLERIEDLVLRSERKVEPGGEVAFGQYIAPPDGSEKQGQYGIFGTAAGLEILASSVRRKNWLPAAIASGQAAIWRRQVLGSWLHLQRRLVPVDGSPAPQSELVLRQAQVLRSLVAIDDIFVETVGVAGADSPAASFPPTELARATSTERVAATRATLTEAVVTLTGQPPDEETPNPQSQDADASASGELEAPMLLAGAPAGTDSASFAAAIEELRLTWPEWAVAKANHAFANAILRELKKSREESIILKVSNRPRPGINAVPGYRFASTSDYKPGRRQSWAFHQAAVLSALLRANWSNFISLEAAAEFWSPADASLLFDYATDALSTAKDEDFRVGLFAAWSLLHLDQQAFDRSPMQGERLEFQHTRTPDHQFSHFGVTRGQLEPDEIEKLRVIARAAAKVTLRDQLLQTDLHEPFFYRINRSDADAGLGEDDDFSQSRYRQEHFVVPTTPILLSIIARTDDTLLVLPAAQELLQRIANALSPADVEHVVPGQPSGANGMVNMAYLHEALCEIHDAFMRLAGRSWGSRLWMVVRYPVAVVAHALQRRAVALLSGIAIGAGGSIVGDWLYTRL